MRKATRHNLKKLEQLIHTLGYKVLYEKGNFKSGYCMVEQSNVIVVNRFLGVEARIGLLLDIVEQTNMPLETLKDEELRFIRKLRQSFAPNLHVEDS